MKLTKQGVRDLNVYPRNGKRKVIDIYKPCPTCRGRGGRTIDHGIGEEWIACPHCLGSGQKFVRQERE